MKKTKHYQQNAILAPGFFLGAKDSFSKSIFKWKNLTKDVAIELWIAREMLNSKKKRTATGTFVPMDKTWSQYCNDIGSQKQIVNRWLKQLLLQLL